jgi:hypothetical protein
VSDSTCFFMFFIGVYVRVYIGARSAPEGTALYQCINVSMFSDIPFERLDRYLEDIVKFVLDRIF